MPAAMYVVDFKTVAAVVQAAALSLRDASIRRTGAIHIRSTNPDSVGFLRPPLWTNFTVAGVSLEPLGAAIYRRPVDQGALGDLFMEIMTHAKGTKEAELRSKLQRLLGDGISTPQALPILAELVQAMYLCGISGEPGVSVKVTPTSLDLKTPQERLRIHRKAMEGRKQYRIAKQVPLHLINLLATHMVGLRRSSGRLGGLYRHLLDALPNERRGLEVLFSVAVHVDGMDRVLLDQFDVEHVRNTGVTEGAEVWDQAISLLTRSYSMPYARLQKLLERHLSKSEFLDTFGPASYWTDRRYTPQMAMNHRHKVLKWQRQCVTQRMPSPKAEQPVSPETQLAINLSRAIR